MRVFVFIVVMCFFSNVQARILFQDPTGKELGEAIDNISEKDLKDLSTPDAGQKKLLLGIFYVRGAPEFHISKDCEKSIGFLQDAWKDGVTDAGYTLSTMYYNGICTSQDLHEARMLAAQAAKDGYILAQRMLGMAYLGKKWQELYPEDVSKAVCWLEKAANAGDRVSAGQLAYMYDQGDRVVEDKEKSFYWLKKGVFSKYEDGSIAGFPILAESYEKGDGADVDLIKAYKYYDLSGTAGVEGKQRIAKKMTQEQIDEALRQSKEWQKEHNVQVGGDFIRRAN